MSKPFLGGYFSLSILVFFLLSLLKRVWRGTRWQEKLWAPKRGWHADPRAPHSRTQQAPRKRTNSLFTSRRRMCRGSVVCTASLALQRKGRTCSAGMVCAQGSDAGSQQGEACQRFLHVKVGADCPELFHPDDVRLSCSDTSPLRV